MTSQIKTGLAKTPNPHPNRPVLDDQEIVSELSKQEEQKKQQDEVDEVTRLMVDNKSITGYRDALSSTIKQIKSGEIKKKE